MRLEKVEKQSCKTAVFKTYNNKQPKMSFCSCRERRDGYSNSIILVKSKHFPPSITIGMYCKSCKKIFFFLKL